MAKREKLRRVSRTNKAVMRLVSKHRPAVRKLAVKLCTKPDGVIDVDDLESVGLIALVDSAKRWRRGDSVTFKAFFYKRVRGAMVDHFRRHLKRTHERTVPLSDTLSDTLVNHGTDREAGRPDASDQARSLLATSNLAAAERSAVVRTFCHDETLREVAATLGVSESRACQLRQGGLYKLRRAAGVVDGARA